MKIIVALGHPAHFHLFKHIISWLVSNNNQVKIVITDKDILKKLLEEHGFDYTVIAERKNHENIFNKASKIIRSAIRLHKLTKSYKPDLMIGGLTQPAYVSLFSKIPYVFVGEDDISYTLLQGAITYPFVSHILAPAPTKVGVFKYKKISYSGYQKLAYLHPEMFVPDKTYLKGVDFSAPYYLIRLVNLNAYHDLSIQGVSEKVLDRLINILEKHGVVYISSETTLSDKYKKHKLPTKSIDIHHLMYFAEIYIGDSQSMAVEAAVLGTPSIRFNDFAGRISVLEELEHKYGLTVGIKSKDSNRLFAVIDKFLSDPHLKRNYLAKKKEMLSDSINVTAFIVWFIENYPESAKIIKSNPGYQLRFR
jgi:uncharacterized protein